MGDLQLLKNRRKKEAAKKAREKRKLFDLKLKEYMIQLGKCEERLCDNKRECQFYRRIPLADKRLRKLYLNLSSMLEEQKVNGIFPRMPSVEWMKDHPTECQWDDEVITDNVIIKPSIKPSVKGYILKRIKIV